MLISSSQILEVLRRQNSWWQTGQVPSDLAPPFKRIAYYEIRAFCRQLGSDRTIILSGARRVGKTVLLHQTAQQTITDGTPPKQVLYVSFEDLALTQANLREILDLYEKNVETIREGTLILLDEIHYTPEWTRHLMAAMREYPKARIVATGSAATLLRSTARNESAAGRWVTVHVPTLSFFEYVQLRGLTMPALSPDLTTESLFSADARTREAVINAGSALPLEFHRYLIQGGFPATVRGKDLSLSMVQRLLREDVIDKVLKRDMAQLYGARSLGELDQLFVYLCFHYGAIVERTTLAKEMGIAPATVENHLQRLEDAHLIYRLEPFNLGGKKSLKPRPKIYISDPSLRNAVLLRGEGLLSDEAELSSVVEGAVFKHLYAFYLLQGPRYTYWRDSQDREVDFVLIFPDGRHLAWEVKYREDPSFKSKNPLAKLVEEDKDFKRAWWVTKHGTHYGPIHNGKIFQIPAFLLCYILGHEEYRRWLKEAPPKPGEAPFGESSDIVSAEALKDLPQAPPHTKEF